MSRGSPSPSISPCLIWRAPCVCHALHVFPRVEYSTWAGMIVTQYGRIPGAMLANGVRFHGQPNGASGGQGGSPQRQSAALDELQRYYGTRDTCSEPEDFRPGKLVTVHKRRRGAVCERSLGCWLGRPHRNGAF